MHSIDISVVIPTRNERENIEPLIARLASTLPVGQSQVIFVDDSSDDTAAVIAELAQTATIPVLVLHREPGERSGGLGGAVVAGTPAGRRSGGRRDGRRPPAPARDHPRAHPPDRPATRPTWWWPAATATTARPTGWPTARGKACPTLATKLTKSVFPRRLQEVSDPMSGFFALRLSARGHRHAPTGGLQDPPRGRGPLPCEGGRGRLQFRSPLLRGEQGELPGGPPLRQPPDPAADGHPAHRARSSGRPASPPSGPPVWSSTPSPSGC